MGRNVEQEGKDFFKNHANVTDSNATSTEQGAARYAHEQIADDLAKAMKGMTASEREKFMDSICDASASTTGEYAEFKEVNGKLHVITRGFNMPINMGMTRDTNVEDLIASRNKTAGGHGWDGQDGGW